MQKHYMQSVVILTRNKIWRKDNCNEGYYYIQQGIRGAKLDCTSTKLFTKVLIPENEWSGIDELPRVKLVT